MTCNTSPALKLAMCLRAPPPAAAPALLRGVHLVAAAAAAAAVLAVVVASVVLLKQLGGMVRTADCAVNVGDVGAPGAASAAA